MALARCTSSLCVIIDEDRLSGLRTMKPEEVKAQFMIHEMY